MKLGDIMTKSVVTVHLDDTLQRIRDIFGESEFHHLVVTDEGKVVGVISDRDLLKQLSPFAGHLLMERQQDLNIFKRRAHQIMRRRPVVAREHMPLAEASDLLMRKGVTCLPIVSRDWRVRGIVTWRDLLPLCFRCKPSEADAA